MRGQLLKEDPVRNIQEKSKSINPTSKDSDENKHNKLYESKSRKISGTVLISNILSLCLRNFNIQDPNYI